MKTTVWFTSSFIGFHYYPNAPKECAHLSALHRHKFNVRVELAVKHDNRDVEFHHAKAALEIYLHEDLESRMAFKEQSPLSCEQLAKRIMIYCAKNLDYSVVSVSVDEDGECGATVAAGDDVWVINNDWLKTEHGQKFQNESK